MKKRILIIVAVVASLMCWIASCNSGGSPDNSAGTVDSTAIAAGEVLFNKNCASCHNFKQDGIGPKLDGLTTLVSTHWIREFIKNPQGMIASGDERSRQLFKKYKTTMPSFASMSDGELNAIVAFMDIHKSSGQKSAKRGDELSDPIPDTIELSNLVVELELVTKISPASSGSWPLTRITKLDYQPNTGKLFIVDLRGKLYMLQDGNAIEYMDMAKLRPNFIDEPGLASGFGSFAFHPGFSENGLLYTTHTEAPNSGKADFSLPDSIKATLQWVLTEWKIENTEAAVFSGAGRELLRADMVTGMHGFQEITFNTTANPGSPDYGMLYIGIGDGGSAEEGFDFLLNSKEKIWGAILRIDPKGSNSVNGRYGIPLDNPFVKIKDDKALGEIYAYGFRNPHRISWTKSGKMLACNIGQASIESLNLIMPGHNYGWPIREGSFVSGDIDEGWGKVFPLPADDSIYRITYPVAQYDHDEGFAVTGGFEYWGSSIPLLKNKYLFGDIVSGRLFYVETADIKQGKQAPIREWEISVNGTPATLTGLSGTERADLHFGRDSKGELYILTKTDGRVHRLRTANLKHSKVD